MIDNRKLLVDYIGELAVEPKRLNEAIAVPDSKLIITGVLQRANSFNQNLRRYPADVLRQQAEVYKRTFIAENRAMGELDHPETNVVELQRVSHNLLDLWWEGENLMGKLEIIPTPCGNIAKEILKAGIRLGISSRGLGSVQDLGEGKVEVQDDYEIVCWDLVSNPSTQGAFVGTQLSEGKASANRNSSITIPPEYAKAYSLIDDIISTR